MTSAPRIRCAVYTRKSTEEGLDQAFNSLDAQREACEAYIASQRHEGWRLVSKHYDDGGRSGGTLERPALADLLTDIRAGQIGMVVVYKIDRLTRSLSDFAKLVEQLERNDCSFVSVTQSFNTSSSMGRLTLNVLLSFAQFEREVTAERIRDKIAASKKKGMWMGGMVPLGYDLEQRAGRGALVINPREADQVRTIFEAYDTTPNLSGVCRTVSELGIASKYREFKSGARFGGKPLSRGQIHFILKNPIYAGRVRHKDQSYPGEHVAIVDEDLYGRVQAKLQSQSRRPRGPSAIASIRPPLCGRVFDENGRLLTPSYSGRRSGKRHRYYVSKSSGGRSGWRLPADDLESSVARLVRNQLKSHACSEPACDTVAQRMAGIEDSTCCQLAEKVELDSGQVSITLSLEATALALGVGADQIQSASLSFHAPFQTRRRGVETRIIAGELRPHPDPVLLAALRQAHAWMQQIRSGTSSTDIARSIGKSNALVRTRAYLALLSPLIQVAILSGTQPATLTLERLVRDSIPLDWRDQERKFGFE